MEWNRGFKSSTYATFIDVPTWRDVDRFEITGGNISRSTNQLRESADIDCKLYFDNERWVRVWFDVTQNGETVHTPLFTGLAVTPKMNRNGNIISNSLECYSVLKPLADVRLPRGWYAPINSGISVIEELLATTPAPHIIEENIPVLNDYIIAESNETNLSMLNKILLALGLRLKITGMGEIHICLPPDSVSVEFGSDYDCIIPTFIQESDQYKRPNVLRATMNDDSVIVKDEEDITRRGREIWAEEESCNLNTNETLYEYAWRRLKDRQVTTDKVSYSRRFHPDLYVTDIVKFNYRQLSGTYMITSQKIQLGYGAVTSEEAIR